MPSIRILLLVALPLAADSATLTRREIHQAQSADKSTYTDDRSHILAYIFGGGDTNLVSVNDPDNVLVSVNDSDNDTSNTSDNDTSNTSYTLAPTPAPVPMPGPECCGATCPDSEPEHKYFTINPCPTATCGEKLNMLVDECNTAAVVCCEEHADASVSVYPMIATSNQCWGESTSDVYLNGDLTYEPALTYKQASNQCKVFGDSHTPAKNVRLCSMAEILNRSITGCSSGCEFDCEFVWVSDRGPCHRSTNSYHETGQTVGRCHDKDGNFVSNYADFDSHHKCCSNHGVSLGYVWNDEQRCDLPAGDPGRHWCDNGRNGDPALVTSGPSPTL